MTNIGTAPLPREPYEGLPELPKFTLTSTDIQDGGTAPEWMRSALFGVVGGQDRSAAVLERLPEGTKSFVLTCFDPDAPVPSGFWHWTVSNIPANVTSIDTGADAPAGALTHRNDAGVAGFLRCPPAGHGPHRYIFCVTAVDVEKLDIDENASPAVVNFNLLGQRPGPCVPDRHLRGTGGLAACRPSLTSPAP